MHNRWFMRAVLFAVRLTKGFQFQSVAAVAPLLGRDFGVGLADIGILIGQYFTPGVARALPGGAIGQRFGDKEDGTRRPAVDVDRRPCDGIVQFLDHADCSTAAGGSDRLARPRQLMAVRAAMMAAPFGEPRPVQAFQPGSGPAL